MVDNKTIELQKIVENATTLPSKASALNVLAWRYNYLSMFDDAISCAESALEISCQSNTIKLEGDAWNILADIDGKLGKFQSALEKFQKAISIFTLAPDDVNLPAAYCNCGNIYKKMGYYENALNYYQKAVLYFKKLNHIRGLGTSLGNIGNVYHQMEEYEKALEYHQKALLLYEGINYKEGIATAYSNIGNANFELHNYDNALKFHKNALELDTELSDIYGIAIHNGNIGKVYAEHKFSEYNPTFAEAYLLKAGELYRTLGNKQLIYEFHRVLSDFYRSQKRWEESDNEFRTFYSFEREVQSEEAKKQAEQMEHRRKIEEAERDRQINLARFQEREKILDNILPSQITERLIRGEQPIADKAENVSVFFSDIVGFTILSQKISAKELVSGLNDLFIQYDILAKKHGLEKIKTIGDAYMAVCGVPVTVENHTECMAKFALGIQELFENGITIAGHTVQVRIGLHCGSVIAGVIGENKFAYDLWGDAVNTASRMESHGEAGKIHVSEEFMQACIDARQRTGRDLSVPDGGAELNFIPRGEMEIKGKGMMKTYFLEQKQ